MVRLGVESPRGKSLTRGNDWVFSGVSNSASRFSNTANLFKGSADDEPRMVNKFLRNLKDVPCEHCSSLEAKGEV